MGQQWGDKERLRRLLERGWVWGKGTQRAESRDRVAEPLAGETAGSPRAPTSCSPVERSKGGQKLCGCFFQSVVLRSPTMKAILGEPRLGLPPSGARAQWDPRNGPQGVAQDMGRGGRCPKEHRRDCRRGCGGGWCRARWGSPLGRAGGQVSTSHQPSPSSSLTL